MALKTGNSLAGDPIVEPFLIWMWNGVLDRDKIRRQLDAFLENGVRAVCIHPMPTAFRKQDFHAGMDVEYLSPEFFEWIAFATEEIRRRDMILWLYDEGGWPSGVALGRVAAEDPDFRAWTLLRTPHGPEARHPQAAGDCPDLMNPEATECFIRLTHERYREAVGSFFGTTIRGIFTDEARLFGEIGTDEIPWSPLVPGAYAIDHGRDLDADIDRLFARSPQNSPAQHRYLRTVSRLIIEGYYAPLRRWCERHGLLLEGHHTGEDDFAGHARYFGDYLEQARQYHIPGVDAIWRQVFPGKPGGNYVALAPSSAWGEKKKYALSESFAVYGQGLTLEQMHWVAAYQLVRGVNRFGIMTTLYADDGPRRICTCHDLAPRDPRWEDADLFFEFVRRTANLIAAGRPRPTVGILYRPELIPPDEREAFNAEHERLCERVLDGYNALMFVRPDDLGCTDLRAVVLHAFNPLDSRERVWIEAAPMPCLDASEPRDFREFSLISPVDGPPHVRVLPVDRDGGTDLLFFNEDTEASAEVRFSPPGGRAYEDLPLDPGDVSVALFPPRIEGNRIVLVLLPGQMRALTPASGEMAPSPSSRPRFSSVETLTVFSAGWRVRVLHSYIITDAGIVRREGDPAPKSIGIGDLAAFGPDFSGVLEYTLPFDAPERARDSRIVLDLGNVCWSARVVLNGREVGRRAWSPFWFDVTDALKERRNLLRVEVRNTLANQWLRPDIVEKDRTCYPNPYRTRVLPWLPETASCGIAGPVRLLRIPQITRGRASV